jgi:hypothetical protein
LRDASSNLREVLGAFDLFDVISVIGEWESGRLLLVGEVDHDQTEGAAQLP